MLILCVVFALLTVGLVVPCAIDVAMTPDWHFDVPSKQVWLTVVLAFWAFGAAAWLLVGRREVRMRRLWDDVTYGWTPGHRSAGQLAGRSGADYPFRSARATRRAALASVRFVAPDDNPEFLSELDRRIRGWRDGE